MRKQQKFWGKEHKTSRTIPSVADQKPSSSVVYFLNFLKSRRNFPKKVIDIGCGKGRNSIFLVEHNFEVFAVDYIKSAVDYAKSQAVRKGLSDKIHFLIRSIDKKWPFANNYFDFAIDCFSSIDIETKDGRETYKKEMLRTLKPRGYALVTVVSADDEMERELIEQSPGPEQNSAIWPNGKFQKDYSEEELKKFYKEFKIVKLQKIKKPAFKLGRKYIATNYLLILQKPQ